MARGGHVGHSVNEVTSYLPRRGANSYKAGNDDVFSLFHAETD